MLKQIGFITGTFFMFSCGSSTTSEQKQEAVKKDTVSVVDDECSSRFKEAKRLDDVLQKANVVNNDIAEQAIKAFYEFSVNCKSDTLAPVFLIKAGQVSQTLRKYTQAQAFFTRCIDDFPKFKSRGAAMFLLAQLYDDPAILNNESEARTIYEQVIREYPTSSYATDAKACIKNLGKSDEELVKEFLKKNK
ncbi:MAG: tetratricopeptide repeat protein [Burkholderiales bacterium]|nr:tetratricopeptide repeat protein [Bacteroidia bacterium]